MRQQLNETAQTDRYLLGEMTVPEARVFEARALTSPLLRGQVALQQQVYRLLRWAGRRQRKAQLEELYQQLLHDKSFQHDIRSIFP